jgi:16S rRNA (uracil1498-N3)-methyltransferase
MQLFYLPEINGNTAELDSEESIHCTRVLRLNIGDKINIIDGCGHFLEGNIAEIHKKGGCLIHNIQKTADETKRPYKLTVAIAPTKNNDRLEWFLEKATEIGIDEIVPIICEHSERKNLNTERCRKILISAMKQSVKATLPTLYEPIAFKQWLQSVQPQNTYMAHCDKNFLRQELLKQSIVNKHVTILIGPEGDFSGNEIEAAQNIGIQGISLGESRLRTETAGVFTVAMVQIMNQL